MSHFSFSKMSQCRPTFFIVKHKTAHKYAAKKVLFRYTQRTVQYCKPCDTVVLTNRIYNFRLLFGGESVCSSSTVWFSFTGPLAAKARIIPLDQRAMQGPYLMLFFTKFLHCSNISNHLNMKIRLLFQH